MKYHGTPSDIRYIGTGLPNPTPAIPRWWCEGHKQYHNYDPDPLTVGEDIEDTRAFLERADKWAHRFAGVLLIVAAVYLTAHVLVAAGVACPTK